MTDIHPNVAVMMRLDLRDLAASADLFAPDVVWHYYNPRLPDLAGDYVGLDGIRDFFQALGARSQGTFSLEPVSVEPRGDELVVAHTRNTMNLGEESFTIDAVTVWRFVEGKVAEVWDIPSVYVLAT